jgi:hypothetical protein
LNNEERGPWYLLTGLIIGIALGILYTRFLQPVKFIDTTPASLNSEAKNQYRALIAAAYMGDGDLVRAKARLELLNDADIFRALTEQAQQTLAQNGSSSKARSLGLLAIALGQTPPGPGQAVTQARPNPTSTRLLSTPVDISGPMKNPAEATAAAAPIVPATDEPLFPSPGSPTLSIPTATIAASDFVLLGKTDDCGQMMPEPIIKVEANDQSGQPVQGVLVIVTWAGGEERFYTGLKPEMGLGYADYTLDPNFVYSLRLGENGAPLGNLGAVACKDSQGNAFWGALSLKYGQP